MPQDTILEDNKMIYSSTKLSTSRRMKGWVVVECDEELKSSTPAQNILPPGQKRARTQPQLFGNTIEQEKSKLSVQPRPSKHKNERTPFPKIRVGGRSRFKEYNQLEREIKRLKMQNNLLSVAESEEIRSLKSEVKRLENLKAEQNKKIDRLIAHTAGCTSSDAIADESEIIQMKDREIDRQNDKIKDLRLSLINALRNLTRFSSRKASKNKVDRRCAVYPGARFTREIRYRLTATRSHVISFGEL